MELVGLCFISGLMAYTIALALAGGSDYLHQNIRAAIKNSRKPAERPVGDSQREDQQRSAAATAYWQRKFAEKQKGTDRG